MTRGYADSVSTAKTNPLPLLFIPTPYIKDVRLILTGTHHTSDTYAALKALGHSATVMIRMRKLRRDSHWHLSPSR